MARRKDCNSAAVDTIYRRFAEKTSVVSLILVPSWPHSNLANHEKKYSAKVYGKRRFIFAWSFSIRCYKFKKKKKYLRQFEHGLHMTFDSYIWLASAWKGKKNTLGSLGRTERDNTKNVTKLAHSFLYLRRSYGRSIWVLVRRQLLFISEFEPNSNIGWLLARVSVPRENCHFGAQRHWGRS